MSRLKVISGKEVAFEEACKTHGVNTPDIKGFRRFNLIKGNMNKEYSLYIFHSEWNSKNDFINWTRSDLFNLAYKDPTPSKKLYLGPPNFDGYQGEPDFEGFEVVI